MHKYWKYVCAHIKYAVIYILYRVIILYLILFIAQHSVFGKVLTFILEFPSRKWVQNDKPWVCQWNDIFLPFSTTQLSINFWSIYGNPFFITLPKMSSTIYFMNFHVLILYVAWFMSKM